MTPTDDDGRRDFDFLHGRWRVRNERLCARLAGLDPDAPDSWEVFDARSECVPVLGGLGNLERFDADWRDAGPHEPWANGPWSDSTFRGLTLRLFRPTTRDWHLHWVDHHDGVLEPAVVGRFDGDVGTFEGELIDAGRAVRARFTWTRHGAHVAHWQQAFSLDGGATWESNWRMWLRRLDADDRLVHDDAVLELRQYALHPGRRDDLVALFERELIEPQEAVGMHVLGQFRDLDADDRFVWLRAFPSMPARRDALQGFYSGPTWRHHRDAANATMIDSDDVRLLRPARPGGGLAPGLRARAGLQAGAVAEAAAFAVGVCTLRAPAGLGFLDEFERSLAPRLRALGAELLASYVTEPSENTFPGLPVRTDAPVLAWIARFDGVAALQRHVAALAADAAWRDAVARALRGDLTAPPQLLRLAPTPRSELR